MTHWATLPVGPRESKKHAATALLYQEHGFDLGLFQDQVRHKYTKNAKVFCMPGADSLLALETLSSASVHRA